MSDYNKPQAAVPAIPDFAATIAKEARKPFVVDITGDDFVAIPDGYRLEHFDALRSDPDRRSGTVSMDTAGSFIEAVNIFKAERSRIYCKVDEAHGTARFAGVINDHGSGDTGLADYRDHLIEFAPRQSVEWRRWLGSHGKQMQQAAFAAFLEDNMADIASVPDRPTGSQMLEMALNLEITQDAAFRSAVRLQSGGVTLQYVAKEDDATLKTMQVFERFALGIAPFDGGPSYRLDAKLRYRLQGSQCHFWYELIRPDLVVRDAVREIVEKVRADTALPVLMGALVD